MAIPALLGQETGWWTPVWRVELGKGLGVLAGQALNVSPQCGAAAEKANGILAHITPSLVWRSQRMKVSLHSAQERPRLQQNPPYLQPLVYTCKVYWHMTKGAIRTKDYILLIKVFHRWSVLSTAVTHLTLENSSAQQ